MRSLIWKSLHVCAVAVMSLAIVGCESKAGSGALIGGGTGAAVGGIIGHQSGKTGQGALIGGAIGAIGGGLVGHGMDENDKKEERRRDSEYQADYDRRNSTYQAQPSQQSVTKSDVINWTNQGVRDDIIIDRIERSGVVFNLTAGDQNDLRDKGVSESVITAMKDTRRR